MLDYIESSENSALKKFYDMTEGLPEGKFKCPSCDKISNLDEAMPISNNPYAMPVCGDCFDITYANNKENSK